MNIPDCYEAFRQAENREYLLDRQESQRVRCGCCGRTVEPGEPLWTVLRHKETFSLCRSCKEDVDDSVTILEEDSPYDV